MEGSVVNNYTLEPTDCIKLVQEYFREIFPEFKLTKEGTYTGYWWVEYKLEKENTLVYFDGDIGGHFSIKIHINNDEYYLWQFDKNVNQRTISNKENIIYQIEVLKKFFYK